MGGGLGGSLGRGDEGRVVSLVRVSYVLVNLLADSLTYC
jgi:hypothetical protein